MLAFKNDDRSYTKLERTPSNKYKYFLTEEKLKEKRKEIFSKLDDQDQALTEERLARILQQVKQDAEKNAKELSKYIEGNFDEVKKFFDEIKQELGEIKQIGKKNLEVAEEDLEVDKKTQAGVENANQGINNLQKGQEVIINEIRTLGRKDQDKKPVWFDVRESVMSFTGRQEQLDKIATAIKQGIIVISGLGGVGKSELAIRYARSQYNQEGSVIWIDAETAKESFHRLYKKLGFKIKDEDGEEKNVKSIVEDVYGYFADRKSLFIFDNAERYTAIEKFLPLDLPNNAKKPCVLITSNSEWKSMGVSIKGLVLKDFDDTETMAFVKDALGIKNDLQNEDIANLAKKLHNFPLALQQAVAYIKNTNEAYQKRNFEFKVSNYLKEYEETPKKLLNVEMPTGMHAETIFKTLEVTFDKVKNEEYGQQSLNMLNIISYFASSNIPEKMFLSELASGDQGKLISITSLLEKYSIVRLEQDVLSVHGLVQQVRRLELVEQKEEGRVLEEETLAKALRLLKEHMKDRNSVEHYTSHVTSAWNYASKYDKLIESFIVNDIEGKAAYTTYFHLIAEGSGYEVVEDIINKVEQNYPNKLKEVINARDKGRGIPLHNAALSGDERIVKLLIEKGANVNVKKEHSWTPLHLAAKNGYLGVVKVLLDNEAKVSDKTGYKFTSLHLAARNGYSEIVKLLLDKGADVNAQDRHKYTPLHFAVKNNHFEVVQALLEGDKINVNAETEYRLTPLHLAARNGYSEIVKLLLDKGADVNIKDTGSFTPLHLAALNGHIEVVNKLLKKSEIDVNAQTTKDNTPLHLAAEKGNLEVVKALIARYAKVDVKNEEDKVASDLAHEKNHLEVKNYIIQNRDKEEVLISQVERPKFNKRQGTSGISGQLYEIELSMLFLLQGVTRKEDKKIDSFYLATNMEEAGDLDDVVFKYKYNENGVEKSKIFFLQAKHKETEKNEKETKGKEKKITTDTLLSQSEKGDFLLRKYLSSYRKIKQLRLKEDHLIFKDGVESCDFVIYTNALFNFDKSRDSVEKEYVEPGDILNLKENSKEGEYYYKLNAGKKVMDALRHSLDYEILVRELAKSISSESIDGNKPIFKDYQVSLVERVIERKNQREGKLREEFLNGEQDEEFSSALFEEIKKRKEFAKKSVDELKEELKRKNIQLPNNFGSAEKNDLKLPLPSKLFSDEEIKEFLSELKLFVGQPNEGQLGKIIKQKIQSTYKVEQNDIDTVFSDVEYRVRNWWKKEDEYLTENNKFFQEAARISINFDVKEPVTLFTGRKKELSDLHGKIQRSSEKVTVISQMTSISGLGGIGKTELSRQYIQENSKDYDNNLIWINAESEATLIESFSRLAKNKLRIATKNIDGEEKDIKSIVEEVYKFFSKRKSLFIFDNAENNEYLNRFLSLRSLAPDVNKPYILITSRNREWEKGIEVINLNELKSEEAIEFVKRGLGIEDESQNKEIKALVEKLQHFPLAIQQAIAYIEDQRVIGEFSIDDYLEEYKKKTEDLLDSEVFRGINNDYAKTTFTTWKITIDKIASDREHGELALKVLNAIAYFAPENINREIFLELAVGDERKLRSAVRLLVKYSMVNGKRKQSVLSIHRLVQEVTRLELKGQGKEEENLKEVLKLVEANLKKENLDHSVSAWNHASKHDKLVKEFSKLPIQIISELNGAGIYKEVYLFGEEVLKLFVQLELKQQDILSIRHSIAEVLFKQSKFKEALEAYKNVFNERKKELGEDHFDTLKTWYGMAWTLDRLGRTEEALEEFQKILEKICLEPECSRDRSLFIFKIRDRIAWLLINQYKLKEALEVSKQVLEKKEKLLGLDDPDTLYTKGIVATILSRQNKTEEALRIYEEIFAKYKEALGEDHPTTLNTQHHILIELRTLNKGNSIKLNDVLKSFQELFEKRKRVLEENHSDTLDSYQELAFTLLRLDKPQEALDIYKEIFEKRKEAIGSDQATKRIKHQMAMALNDVGCYQEALTMYKEVFKKRKEILGIDHGMTFNTQKNMLIMSLKRNDLDIVNFLASEEADFNVHYENGETPLMWMIEEKKVDAMKILLQYGADVLARNDHDTVLHQAVSSSNEEVIRLVLNKIKEKDPQNFSEHINAKDTEGDTPLMWAAENGKTNAAKILLEYGADLNAKNNDDETALHWAAKGGYQELVQLLLNKQADPNISDKDGNTPLGLAYKKLDQDSKNDDLQTIVDLLLSVTDKSQYREEQRSVSAEECLPSTSSGRSKREAIGEKCLFTWEDVDEFNEEKDEKRDLSKIKMDGEKFVSYIKDLPEEKQSQLIQLADKVKVTGESQSLVNKLIGDQKVMNHLARVGRISGITMHGMMAKNVLADFLNGDYQGVAINVGFIAGGQGFAKVAEAASLKGLKLASEGKLLLGRSLRAASPFLARGTSAFVVYDLVNQVKAFKNGTEEALVGVVGDSIYLGVDAAEIGIEIAEAFEVLEGVSSVTGPIGTAIGAVVFVGTDVYMAVKRVDKIDQIIHLKGNERFIEGLRAFIGMEPEKHIEELIEEKQLNNQLVKQGLEYLQQHSDIQRYVFPTGKSVVDSCNKVQQSKRICVSPGFNGCTRARTVTSYTEKCTTKFEEDLDNTVLLDRRRTDIKWSRAKPDNPRGGQLFCLPQGNYEPVPNYGSYLCKSAIGLSTNKTGGYTLINLGEGEDYVKGFIDNPNIFVVNNGSKKYHGGNKDDIFILQGSSITGYFYGEGGVNTLDLTSFAPEKESIDVKLHVGQVEDYYQDNSFGMSGINRFLGRKGKADRMFITCDSSTSDIKFVDGQGGSERFVDHIKIDDKDCAYEMQIVVRPNTVVYNRALKGDFHYIVPYALGNAKIDFIYTAEALNLNNTFAFEYEPVQIKNVDVRNINVLNKTSHIITFNFSPMSDKEFNITISGASNPSYRLGNNTEIKVGNKGNLYMLENTNKSVDEIIKDYLVVANRLNKMSFFIQSLLNNETVAIGSGNYEVIHNNPLHKSHLVGNGGENVYVIDSEGKRFEIDRLPIPEVVIYDLDVESSVDTIDLRNLVKQARSEFSNSFELQVLKSANDLLLKATVISEKHEYFTVRLKDGVNWYNKTHVIMDNVPMRINLDNNEWSLKPLPLVFEKDKEVIIVTSQDVEENTELITPRKGGNYTFVRSNSNDLMITNAFDTKDDLCTITLSKFYEEPKMGTLSIKFADKEIILKEHQEQISSARNVNVVKKEHKEQVYHDVFNRTEPEVMMLSDQPVAHEHKHRHSGHRHQVRHRRNNDVASSSAKPSSWINNLFGWVKSSVSGLLGSKSKETSSTTSPILQVDAKMDVNGTIMLLDVIVRKFTGKQYIPAVDQSIPLLEARGYALNITNRFEKVLNKTAIKSGISVTNLNFDPVVVQSAIIEKIINGKFSEIAKTLYSFAKEACPEFKQTDKFLDNLKSNLEEVLAKEETMILQQKVEKPYKDLSQEVSRKVQLSKKPDTFLNGTSVVQGISRAIN